MFEIGDEIIIINALPEYFYSGNGSLGTVIDKRSPELYTVRFHYLVPKGSHPRRESHTFFIHQKNMEKLPINPAQPYNKVHNKIREMAKRQTWQGVVA